jgi:5S rRNA maturation endonuclease (ribonuclease M5)
MFDYIREEAAGLQDGETIATSCPKCRAEHENKFYISSKEGWLLFTCKRASCGFSGSISSNGCYERRAVVKKADNSYTGDPVPLTEEQYKYLLDKYAIDPRIAARDLTWDIRRQAFVAEVTDSKGNVYGTTVRYIKGDVKARSWIQNYEYVTWIGSAKGSKYLFIVEGLLDGLKMARYGDCLVLLGTGLHTNTMNEISKLYARDNKLEIVWLLDPDACDKAIHYQHQTKLYFPSKTVMLKADPKDCDIEYLDSVFN